MPEEEVAKEDISTCTGTVAVRTETTMPEEKAIVRVEGLPRHVTIDEVFVKFSSAGVIKKDPITREPKIILGALGGELGDGFLAYVEERAGDLAVGIFNGNSFKPGVGALMTVKRFNFSKGLCACFVCIFCV